MTNNTRLPSRVIQMYKNQVHYGPDGLPKAPKKKNSKPPSRHVRPFDRERNPQYQAFFFDNSSDLYNHHQKLLYERWQLALPSMFGESSGKLPWNKVHTSFFTSMNKTGEFVQQIKLGISGSWPEWWANKDRLIALHREEIKKKAENGDKSAKPFPKSYGMMVTLFDFNTLFFFRCDTNC